MKKIFSFAMILMVLVAAFGFNVGSASARPVTPPNRVPVVVLTSPYFENLDTGAHLSASVEGMSMGCYVTDNQKVRCVVPKKFTGQYVTINLNVDGTHLSFYVYVPDVKVVVYH